MRLRFLAMIVAAAGLSLSPAAGQAPKTTWDTPDDLAQWASYLDTDLDLTLPTQKLTDGGQSFLRVVTGQAGAAFAFQSPGSSQPTIRRALPPFSTPTSSTRSR